MKMRIKVHETNGDHHEHIEWIEKLGLWYLPVEDWRKRRTNDECRRTVENLCVITHGNVTETLRKHLGLDSVHGNNFPQQFQENTKCQEGWTPSFFIPPPIYSKIGEDWRTNLEGPSGPGCYLHPFFFTKYTPLLFLAILFFRNVTKLYEFRNDTYFLSVRLRNLRIMHLLLF